MSLIFEPQNVAFTVALSVMLGIAILEGVLTVIGAGMSGFLDDIIPDVDAGVEIDADAPELGGGTDLAGPSALSQFLGWLMIGHVPALALLVVFLTAFGISGLFVQGLTREVSGFLLPGWAAVPVALALALPTTRVTGKGLARLIPKDETSAVSRDEFLGLVATITLGTAKRRKSAEGRVRDRHGQSHYIRVEPDKGAGPLEQGSEVLLVARRGSVFKAIRNPNDALSDT